MPTRDGAEIRATLKSLKMLLKQVISGNREASSCDIEWSLMKLDDLLQFAGENTGTAEKLQQAIAEIKQAQHTLPQDESEETPAEFYPLARNAYELMNEIMESSTSGPLESLDSSTVIGRHVVYCDALYAPHIYVGKVETVNQSSLGELIGNGFIADITLLQADNHEELVALFHRTYIYANPKPPVPGLIYAWPTNLPVQTFEELKKTQQHKSICLKTSIQIIIAANADFDNREK